MNKSQAIDAVDEITLLFKNIARRKTIPIVVTHRQFRSAGTMIFDHLKLDAFTIKFETPQSITLNGGIEIEFIHKGSFFRFATLIADSTDNSAGSIALPSKIAIATDRLVGRYHPEDSEPCFLSLPGHAQPFRIRDISTRGMSFAAPIDGAKIDDTLHGAIIRISDSLTITVDAVVKNIRTDHDEAIYGLAFSGTDGETSTTLFAHIFAKTYQQFKSLSEVTPAELLDMFNESQALSARSDGASGEAALEAIRSLEKLNSVPYLAKSFIYYRNGKLLAVGSAIRIYSGTFLERPAITVPATRLSPKVKTDILTGLADYILNHPHFTHYLTYIEEDMHWHTSIAGRIHHLIDDESTFTAHAMTCIKISVSNAETIETSYVVQQCSDPSDFLIFVKECCSPLVCRCYEYDSEKIMLSEISREYREAGLTLERTIWMVLKGNEVVAYVVNECYSEPIGHHGLEDACFVYPIRNNVDDMHDIVCGIARAISPLCKHHGTQTISMLFQGGISECKLPPFMTVIPITRVIADVQGYVHYKSLLGTVFEYYTKYYPLTYPQKAIWHVTKLFPDTTVAINNGSARIVFDNIDYAALEQAINTSIATNDALRTKIIEYDDEPMQYIEDFHYQSFPFIDFSKKDIREFYHWEEEISQIPIAPTDFPLFKFYRFKIHDNEGGFFLKLHHIISDAWTMATVISRNYQNYTAICRNATPHTLMDASYLDFIHDEEGYKYSARFQKDQIYWRNKFNTHPSLLCLKRSSPVLTRSQSARKSFVVSKTLAEQVNSVSSMLSVSVPTFFLSVIAIYISKIGNAHDIVIGTSMLNRENTRERETAGMFINMIPARLVVLPGMSFASFVEQVRKEWMGCLKHQRFPTELILQEFRKIHSSSEMVYDVTFSFQNVSPQFEQQIIYTRWHPYNHQPEALNIHVSDRGKEGHYVFNLDYLVDLFSTEEINRTCARLIHTIEEVTAFPHKEITAISIVPEEELQRLLVDFNNTMVPYPHDISAHQLIEIQTDKTPGNFAVIHKDQSIIFKDLDGKANQVAHYLLDGGNLSDVPVAVLISNSIGQLVSVLGVLKAGAAYLPIDPEIPYERIKIILQDAKVHTIISQKKFVHTLNKLQWECTPLRTYLCYDSENVHDEYEHDSISRTDRQLWEYVGSTTTDKISGGGWNSSYTGKPFSKQEMDEYSDNILKKIKQHLKSTTRVLEIGCASGLSMFRIAPLVNLYYGTDISLSVIERNQERITRENICNIKLAAIPAHEIAKLNEKDFDIVILNSVIQYFCGYNYLRKVIRTAVGLMRAKGLIFIGDIIDQDRKEEFIESLLDYRRCHATVDDRTKFQWENELFVSRGYFEDLRCDIPAVADIQFSQKIHTIENELTCYRYDATLVIDKTSPTTSVQRHKKQHDSTTLRSLPTTRPTTVCMPDDTAYVIYTSGTTGVPKGTLVSHRSLVNLCFWHKRFFNVTEKDRATRFAGFGFDASVFELFPLLAAGASIHIIDEKIRHSIQDVSSYFQEAGITIGFLPTQFFEQFIKYDHSTLRILYTGGDVLRGWQPTPYLLYNGYGPAECTVAATFFCVDKGYANIPIGKPIDNVQIYILDDNKNPVPIGVIGEIFIAGDGLAKGYLNRAELTQERFIPNPFNPGSKMYRTGDLGNWREDGNIEFHGRKDFQVKIRGFRIELGEIEQRLLRDPRISNVVVTKREDNRGNSHLCAYIVAQEKYTLQMMREHLAKDLPDYMIPAFLVQMTSLLLNSSGKIDRRALPDPAAKPPESYNPPRTPVEKKLVQVWEEVLDKKPIGINDNFFNLGGDSIRAIEISTKMDRYNLALNIKDLFNHPVISELQYHVKESFHGNFQNPVTGAILLTPIQKWFFERHFSDERHYHQTMCLYRHQGFNPQSVISAINTIVNHHDALRMIFQGNSGTILPGNMETKNRFFHFKEIDLTIEMDYEISMKQAIENMYSFNLDTGPLVIVCLFHTRDGDYLPISIHHLVVDGISWRIISNDFKQAYHSAECNKPVTLSTKTSSFIAWSNALSTYAAGKQVEKERSYWRTLVDLQLPLLPKDFSCTTNRYKDNTIARISLSKEQTRALERGINVSFNATVQDILLVCAGIALRDWTNENRYLIQLESHGREPISDDVDITQTVGWFTAAFPFLLEVEDNDYGMLIKKVKEGVRRVPCHGLGYGLLRYSDACPSLEGDLPEINFNYLGHLDDMEFQDDFMYSTLLTGLSTNNSNERPFWLDIEGMIFKGLLHVSIEYNRHAYHTSTMVGVIEKIKYHLLSIIDYCNKYDLPEKTPSDFGDPSLSLDEFTIILDAVQNMDGGIKGKDLQQSISRIYDLSPMQEGMLYNTLTDLKSGVYLEQLCLSLTGEIDYAVFEKSIQTLVARHDVFRTSFIHLGLKSPKQIVFYQRNSTVRFEDLSGMPPKNQSALLESLKYQDREQGISVSSGSLMRFMLIKTGDRSHTFVWLFHHLIMDGWSMSIAIKELFLIYHSLISKCPLILSMPRPYHDFIAWINTNSESVAIQYWTEYLARCQEQTLIPPTTATSSPPCQFNQYKMALDRDTTSTLAGMAKVNNLTLSTLFMGLWGVLLKRYNDHDMVSLGMVVSGRTGKLDGIDTMVGLCINTIPLVISLDGRNTFIDMCQRIQNDLRDSEPHSHISLAKIQSVSPLKNRLIGHIVAFENYRMEKVLDTAPEDNKAYGLKIDDISLTEQITYPFSIMVIPAEIVLVQFTYDTGLYSRPFIENIANHLRHIAHMVIRNQKIAINEIDILTPEEWVKIVNGFNRSFRDLDNSKLLHELFKMQVLKTPRAIAIVTDKERISFEELDMRSDALAHLLCQNNVGPESIVAIMAAEPSAMPVPILAVLKAGGAYLAIDPSYPVERVQYILKDCAAKVFLTQGGLWGGEVFDVAIIDIDDCEKTPDGESDLPHRATQPENSAYVIYTSGTTGKPKGVIIEHRQISNQIQGFLKKYEIDEQINHILLAKCTFDVSVQQLFVPLCSGGCLHIPADSVIQNPIALAEYIRVNGINFLNCTPAFIQLLAENTQHPITVRYLFVGGDIFTRALYEKVKETIHAEKTINIYGPTETTINATAHECLENEPGDCISIGKPLFNYQAYVLNQALQPVPVGVPGELYIGGNGVVREYLHQPEITIMSFLPDLVDPDKRMYKSGDRVRWSEAGELEFLGRKDTQVKIRGVRIELGEIESCLRQHPAVEDAVVIVSQITSGASHLSAFITTTGTIQTEGVWTFLAQHLPPFMIPHSIITLPQLPLTRHQKIDKNALIALVETQRDTSNHNGILPGTDTEEALMRIWQNLLEREDIGVTDSFRDLGGDSLMVMKMACRIENDLNIRIPITELVKRRTIRGIAVYLTEEKSHFTGDKQVLSLKRSKNNNKHIFFIHAGNGTIEAYLPLCEHLSFEANYWGICSEPYDVYPRNKPSIDEIARRYIEKIMFIQPAGPFIIAGWCIGGTIAFEMARQLEQQGKPLSALLLISSLGPGAYNSHQQNQITTEIIKPLTEKHLPPGAFSNQEISDDLWFEIISLLSSGKIDLRNAKNALWESVGRAIPNFKRLSAQELIGYLNRIKIYTDIRTQYALKKTIAAPVHFLKAAETPEISISDWEPYCQRPIWIHMIDGDHYSLFSPPNVQLLAKAIDQILIAEGPICTTKKDRTDAKQDIPYS